MNYGVGIMDLALRAGNWKKVFRLFVPVLIVVSLAGCAQDPVPPRPGTEPSLVHRPALPAPLAVIASQRLEPHAPTSGPPEDFGKAVALGEGVLAVGAPDETSGEMGQNGSVLVYRRQGDEWVEEAQLFASDQTDASQHKQNFGKALAFSGDLLCVGAPGADAPQVGEDSGAVYVFQDAPGGWIEVARLVAEQPQAGAGFGSILAASGDTLAVGDGYYGQRVTLFQGISNNRVQRAEIKIPQMEGTTASLGSLALNGDTLALNVGYRQGEGMNTQIYSRILIYERSGSEWQKPIELPTTAKAYTGGISLDGDGRRANRLAAGTNLDDFLLGSKGVAVFERGSLDWELRETLTSPDGGSSMMYYALPSFGASLALQGDLLVVGEPFINEDNMADGQAYLFERNQGRWVEQLRLTQNHDGGEGDFFGGPIALQGNTVLISAADEFGQAVYVFEIGNR